MSENTIKLEIPILLHGVEKDDDDCVTRLEEALAQKRGILRAHVDEEGGLHSLCVHYDPNLTSIDEVRATAESAGQTITERYHHEIISIEGMDCSDCVTVIEHGLGRMDGVLDVSVSYVFQNMRVEYDSKHVKRADIEKKIRNLGYDVPAEGIKSWYQENEEVLFSLFAGFLVLVGWVGETFLGLNHYVAIGLFVAAYFFGGMEISHHAWHAIKERHFDTDLLMVMAAIGAAILGRWMEGGLLLFLFSLGHSLEERAMEHARSAITALADLTPKIATVKRGDKEEETPIDNVEIGDVVVVKPGVRLPVDGTVVAGASFVDQATVTGESVPVEKTVGSQVFASTINGDGAIEVRATRLAKDSTLARVIELVEEAQTQKSPTQQTMDKFSAVFVPAVLIADLLLIVIPPFFGVPFRESFMRAMILLVAASPCALALGTPSAILAGIAQAARHGVLIKGGAHLENLGRINAIAFDKTGTITAGKPQVTDVLPYGGIEENELLALAASIESRSAHPLAKAVVQAAAKLGLSTRSLEDVTSLTGLGLKATVENKVVVIGNLNLIQANGGEVSESLRSAVEGLEADGKTVMTVARDGTVIGLIAVADVPRDDAKNVISALSDLGVGKSIMLTGDNPLAAEHIGSQVGVGQVMAELLPEDKLTAIRSLVEENTYVGMVGDGVNDAPALANATVGIAMGGAGTDVALESADVVLMGDDLSKLPFVVGLSRASRSIITQNLAIALGVIALLVVASVTGKVSIGPAVALHEGSTIVVVLNALRLLNYKSA